MGWESPGAEKHVEKSVFSCFCFYFSAVSCLFPWAVEFVLRNLTREQEGRPASAQVILWITRMLLWWPLIGCGALCIAVSSFLGQGKVLVPQIRVERTCDVWNRNSISAVSATSTECNRIGMCRLSL